MTEVGDLIYVCIFISRSVGFHLHVFFCSICTYVPTLPTLHLHVCGLIQKTFSHARLSFTFFLSRTRFSRSAVPLLIAGRKPICKELEGRLQNYWCGGGGCGGK